MVNILPKMIDMAMKPDSKHPPVGVYDSMPSEPTYPYGMCLSLGDAELTKLGLEKDVEVGDMLSLSILCRVTSVRKDQTQSGDSTRIELQITHVADEEGEPAKPTSRTFYKK